MAKTKAAWEKRSSGDHASEKALLEHIEERYSRQVEAIGQSIVNRFVLGQMEDVRGPNVRDAFLPLVNDCAMRMELASQGHVRFDAFRRSGVATSIAVKFKEAVEKGKLDRFLTPGTLDVIRGAHARSEAYGEARRAKVRGAVRYGKAGPAERARADKRIDALFGGAGYREEPRETVLAWNHLYGKGSP